MAVFHTHLLSLACLLPAIIAMQMNTFKIEPGYTKCDDVKHMTFPQFTEKHGRAYRSKSEYQMREALYLENLVQIDELNCKYPWRSGVTSLTDWSLSEIKSLFGYRPAMKTEAPAPTVSDGAMDLHGKNALPQAWSWGNLSAIQEGRDQGSCGSCWAFAAEVTMRAHSEIHTAAPKKFSVQQLVDCVPNPQQCGGSGGCSGATCELAFDYVMKHGLVVEDDRPYTATDAACPSSLVEVAPNTTVAAVDRFGVEVHQAAMEGRSMQGSGIGMRGWMRFQQNKGLEMMKALVVQGPTTVPIAASPMLSFYFSGIMSESGCDGFTLNHAVVLYGYGHDDGQPYWQLKNSWGAFWGEQGSFRLTRRSMEQEESHCGWNNHPEMGLGCKGGPKRVWVCGTCGILYDSVMPRFTDF